MDDFFVRPTDPAEVSRHLRRIGYRRPESIPELTTVDPWDVEASEWNRLGPNAQKSSEIAMSNGRKPPVLVYPEGSGYRVVDGIHRTDAARMNDELLAAVVIPRDVYVEIVNFGDRLMYEWALGAVGEWP